MTDPCVPLTNYCTPAGDTSDLSIAVGTFPSGFPSGFNVTWQLFAQTYGNPYGLPLLVKHLGAGIEYSISPAMLTVALNETDTAGLLGNYYYEATIIDHSLERMTVAAGLLTVEQTALSLQG